MKTSELLSGIMPVRISGEVPEEITELCYDSRRVVPGCVFVAIRGYALDGHKFISSAVASGASLVVCEEAPEADVPYILVDNSRQALAVMSANRFDHPERSLKLIGVTGTKGKTTVTHLIKHVLDRTGNSCGLIGTNGNIVGTRILPADRTTPESYEVYSLLAQMRDAGCTHAVMEVSSHSLVLDRVHGLHYSVAAFTNLSRDHLDFHKTMEEYLDAKSILFTRCDKAVINYDDPAGQTLLKRIDSCEVLTLSAKDDSAGLIAKNLMLREGQVSFEAVMMSAIARVSLPIPGLFSVYNALTALGCCISLGIELPAAAEALRSIPGIKGRAEVVPTDMDYTVIIDYAHSPDSMENILKALRPFVRGRLIAMFGAGGHRDRGKRPLMGKACGMNADVCVVTSDNPRDEKPADIISDILPGMEGTPAKTQVIEDRREAIRWVIRNAKTNDLIVLLGKGQETYQEVNGEKLHLDEREEVAAALAELKRPK